MGGEADSPRRQTRARTLRALSGEGAGKETQSSVSCALFLLLLLKEVPQGRCSMFYLGSKATWREAQGSRGFLQADCVRAGEKNQKIVKQ